MSDTTARRKQRRSVSDRHVDTLTRYHLRSEIGIAQPSDEVGARLMARVAATPRPARPLTPPTPGWLLRWRDFMAATPRMSARLSSLSAAALLMFLMVHSSMSTLDVGAIPTPSSAVVRPPYDALAIVERRQDPAVDTSREDLRYEDLMMRPRLATPPFPQDALVQPVYPAPDSSADTTSAPSDEREDLSTLVPPQSRAVRSSPIIAPSTAEPGYLYAGSTVR
jgi:hypothetical protein